MDTARTTEFVDSVWDAEIVPSLEDYITIPALSPLFDPEWRANGHIDRAMDHIADWCAARNIEGMTWEIVRLEGRTPLLYMEIPGATEETVLLYGHMDKQPPFTGWRDDLGPWKPVIEDGKLYGRGGADDGYAAYGSLAAIEALQRQGIPHPRCIVLIEGSEESGSPDLPAYLDHLSERIGTPGLIVCLDSGAGNYDQLWVTTSLRGIVVGDLRVDVLTEGVHSGMASGIVPSSFRIARALLGRIEDAESGVINVPEFLAEPEGERLEQVRRAAEVLGDEVWRGFPYADGTGPVTDDVAELVLNNTWRPALSVVGAHGFPEAASAGNVLRTHTTLKLSLRLPPTVDAPTAARRLKEILEADPPHGAKVAFDIEGPGSGWAAPVPAPWLARSLEAASEAFFGRPVCYRGEGGSIPFMNMLGEKYPETQFLVTGVLGPRSNAHGPNEFLHIATGKRLTACVARVLADYAAEHAAPDERAA
ncbi:MAG TPA: M20 family metallopeptidase [Woeseiaceae bacterium]|nr:M20 family metallopeptidase [Woeseiaceae bacterium]